MTSRAFPILAVVLLVVSGCSAAHVVSQWRDPEYTTPLDVKCIMVVGVSKQAGIRRKFEDVLVERLKEEGIDAVQSYLYIPEDGPVPEDRLQDAVRRANADATLVTRLVRVERQTEVVPGYYSPPVRPGWYPWYTSAWTGYYEPPRVYQRDIYISETSSLGSQAKPHGVDRHGQDRRHRQRRQGHRAIREDGRESAGARPRSGHHLALHSG